MSEWAVVLPFLAFIAALLGGADGDELRLPFLICEVLGIMLYMAEIRYRFRKRHGRRP